MRGKVVLDGLLMISIAITDRACARLICPRELVLLDGPQTESLPATERWSVLAPARLAVFDDRLLAIGQRSPRLLGAILKRAAQQSHHAFLQQTISQLPRVEDRLLALLWAIADRQSIVRADGVFVPLSATHDLLAQMVGAKRPTATLGLTHLTDRGVLRAQADGWLIHPTSLDEFSDDPNASTLHPLLSRAEA